MIQLFGKRPTPTTVSAQRSVGKPSSTGCGTTDTYEKSTDSGFTAPRSTAAPARLNAATDYQIYLHSYACGLSGCF